MSHRTLGRSPPGSEDSRCKGPEAGAGTVFEKHGTQYGWNSEPREGRRVLGTPRGLAVQVLQAVVGLWLFLRVGGHQGRVLSREGTGPHLDT